MVDALLEQLHDIEGLDAVHWWPLASGWWVVIFAAALLLTALICYAIYAIAFMYSWKGDSLCKLDLLEENLCDENARETLIIFSGYLRRIALRRFSRKECAGLTGRAWLKWLAAHDPKKFDWEEKGVMLVYAPYAPAHIKLSSEQVKELLQASRSWVY